jgi:hypothetical protein
VRYHVEYGVSFDGESEYEGRREYLGKNVERDSAEGFMTLHELRCWDCQYHKRQLVETTFGRPLYFTSICRQGHDVRIEKCKQFVAAEVEQWVEEFTSKA